MKKNILLITLSTLASFSFAQKVVIDSANASVVSITADSRLDKLAEIEAKANTPKTGTIKPEYNTNPRAARGYRLMVISTNDRNMAMKVRSQLLSHFPDQKAYMSYQAPNIKIKFGNFLDRADAERYRRQILGGKIVTTNVYIVPETIEVKPVKDKEPSDDTDKPKDKPKGKSKSKK